MDVRVDLFWDRQPKKSAYVTNIYDMMSRICDGTIQTDADPGWDVSIRVDFGKL